MTGMPAVAALQTADGMGSAVIFLIVDVEDAGSGSVPRASVMVRGEFLCFLNLLSFLKMVFISLSVVVLEAWRQSGRKKEQRFNSDQSPILFSNNSDNY